MTIEMHVLPGAGHFALETNVAEIAALIDAFLAKTGVKNY
jgi:pimeloyl-ACP methyl ester carboxylesterase